MLAKRTRLHNQDQTPVPAAKPSKPASQITDVVQAPRTRVEHILQPSRDLPRAKGEMPIPLQETVLTALCFNDKYGGEIAAKVEAENFDGAYRQVADRVLVYRRKYQRAPGRSHIDDLFAAMLSKATDSKAERLRRTLAGLVQLSKEYNAQYAAEQVGLFLRRQTLSDAILKASNLIGQGKDSPEAIEEADQLMRDYTALNFDNTSELEILSPAILQEMDIEPPLEIMSPWLFSGTISMIHATPGIGKTGLAFHIANSLAQGRGGLGDKWVTLRTRRVLYVEGEIAPAWLVNRTADFVPNSKNLKIISKLHEINKGRDIPSLYTRKGQALIDRAVESIQADVIILDSIVTLFGFTAQENEAEAWSTKVDPWLKRHAAQGRAIILIHHPPKASPDSPYGTNARAILADTQINLVKVDENEDGKLIQVKSPKHRHTGDPGEFTFRLKVENKRNWIFTVEDTPGEVRSKSASDKRQRILELAKAGELNNTQIAAQVGVTKQYVSKVLGKKPDTSLLPDDEQG
jgi:hypothetical protein